LLRPLEDLLALVSQACGGETGMQSTVLQEGWQMLILYALCDVGLTRSLVFQGGTSLRLCHGGTRFSEDLDFVCSSELDAGAWRDFSLRLAERIAPLPQGDVLDVRPPRAPLARRSRANHVQLHRWRVRLRLAPREGQGARSLLVNVEVADVPAYDVEARLASSPILAPAMGASAPCLLRVCSRSEILADKVLAVAGREYIKARDLWDIHWLRHRQVGLRLDWVQAKAGDYSISDLPARLQERCQGIAQPGMRQAFCREMSRFLDHRQAARWLADEAVATALLAEVHDFLRETAAALSTPAPGAASASSGVSSGPG